MRNPHVLSSSSDLEFPLRCSDQRSATVQHTIRGCKKGICHIQHVSVAVKSQTPVSDQANNRTSIHPRPYTQTPRQRTGNPLSHYVVRRALSLCGTSIAGVPQLQQDTAVARTGGAFAENPYRLSRSMSLRSHRLGRPYSPSDRTQGAAVG